MDKGSIGSMRELGVTESYKLKRQVVLSASEAAEMIIRYDTIHLYIFLNYTTNFLSTVLMIFCVQLPGNVKLFRDCSITINVMINLTYNKIGLAFYGRHIVVVVPNPFPLHTSPTCK